MSKLLNHLETGVTAIYDRYSYDPEKQQALAAWGAKINTILAEKTEQQCTTASIDRDAVHDHDVANEQTIAFQCFTDPTLIASNRRRTLQ